MGRGSIQSTVPVILDFVLDAICLDIIIGLSFLERERERDRVQHVAKRRDSKNVW